MAKDDVARVQQGHVECLKTLCQKWIDGTHQLEFKKHARRDASSVNQAWYTTSGLSPGDWLRDGLFHISDVTCCVRPCGRCVLAFDADPNDVVRKGRDARRIQ